MKKTVILVIPLVMLATGARGVDPLAVPPVVNGVFLPAAADDDRNALTLSFGDTSVTVSGIQPRGQVYVYTTAREPRGYRTSVTERDVILQDEDGDASVAWAFPRGVPWRSIWLAVDLTAGTTIARSHPDYPATAIDLLAGNLKKDAAGNVAQLAMAGNLLQFVVVRPGTGVWSAAVGTRGPLDEGTESGKVTLSTLNLRARAGTAQEAPKHLRKGDVVLVLNSFRAEYATAVVGDK